MPKVLKATAWVAIIIATLMIVAASPQTISRSPRTWVYAGLGEELVTFAVDVTRATLTRSSAVILPGFVQEAWSSPSAPFLYVAWSNGGASYSGTGITGPGDRHGVTAFQIDGAGELRAVGDAAALRSRPIHVTGDITGTHLLVAYNDPSGVSVHAIERDGTIGAEVQQRSDLDVGIYGHQVRVFPSNKAVVLVTRGNEPTANRSEDPGALKIFRYDDGRLTNAASVAPLNGVGFRSRHLDFHPTRPWAFLTLEAQNRLAMFKVTDDMVEAQPTFQKSTLADGGGVVTGQTTSSIHVHPSGRFVYVANRGTRTEAADGMPVFAGGINDIAVFRIDQHSGEPALVQNVATRGFTPRTFAIDPAGRILIVGNQTTMDIRDGGTTKTVASNLAVFRIGSNGTLTFVRTYGLASGRKPLWWVGLVAGPR